MSTNRDDDEKKNPSAENIATVRKEELAQIVQRRRSRQQVDENSGATESNLPSEKEDPFEQRVWNARLLGLALSGGGIRSATFNLGLIQSLAKNGLLSRIDYLSTVSGGGYIGGWLSALVARRHGAQNAYSITNLEKELSESEPNQHELPAITHLRRFSNYLTPKRGLLSADTWAVIAIYLRNLVLNLIIIVTAFCAAITVIRVLQNGMVHLAELATSGGCPEIAGRFIAGAVIIVSGVAGWSIFRNLATLADSNDGASGSSLADDEGTVVRWVVFPIVVVSLIGGVFMPITFELLGINAADDALENSFAAAVLVTVIYGTVWLFAWLISKIRSGSALSIKWFWSALGTGAIAGWALWWVTVYALAPLALEARTALGAPLILIWATLLGFIHIGLMGRKTSIGEREWMSRLGGWLLISALAWTVIYGLVYFIPFLAGIGLAQVNVGLILGWAGSAVAAILASGDKKTPANKLSAIVSKLGLFLAPYLFILGFIAVLAIGLNMGLVNTSDQFSADHEKLDKAIEEFHHSRAKTDVNLSEPMDISDEVVVTIGASASHKKPTETTLSDVFGHFNRSYRGANNWETVSIWILGLVVAFLAFSARVGINVFSLSNFYKNRLERCYLRASIPSYQHNDRVNPFSGFSKDDAIDMAELRDHDGPYHLINSAINLADTDNLAWQERMAGSFCITPHYYGYSIASSESSGAAGNSSGNREHFYRETTKNHEFVKTKKIRGLSDGEHDATQWSLSDAIATSGAAASSSMGHLTTPALAFLLTIFNIRLGRWIGNPAVETNAWRLPSPRLALKHLLMELFGSTNAKSPFVYLSDGGHFDNLGIYELVRRRCRYIIACDVGADPEFEFEDLGNAIRKCRADFGVDIEISVDEIRNRDTEGFSNRYCAVGRIHYSKEHVGTLLYIKSSLTGSEPEDVLNYAASHDSFPHQTTADQFFSESQFESYRTLGECVGNAVLERATERMNKEARDRKKAHGSLESLFLDLRHQWWARASASSESYVSLTKRLDQIFERLRSSSELSYLDYQFYPEFRRESITGYTPPQVFRIPEGDEFREGFYLCNSLIQLMEDVYLELKLESDWNHPDNAGWMNLFRHWSWSAMFRVTWAISAATYGQRFRKFCENELNMTLGEVELQLMRVGFVNGKVTFDGVRPTLNFWERAQLTDLYNCVADDRALFHLFQLDLIVKLPGLEQPIYHCNFGYCVTRTADKNDKGDVHDLVAFRVQDHLRKMGLGRESLRQLVNDFPIKDAKVRIPRYSELPKKIRDLDPSVLNEASWSALEQKFQSAQL